MANRLVVVDFLYKGDADYLISNMTYLTQGIYIDHENSKETEENKMIFSPYLKAARKLHKYLRKCRLEGDTLLITGIRYTLPDIPKLPSDLSSGKISSINNRKHYGFLGKLHPFSNFYATTFTFQGQEYHSSKQMIQHLKATYFDDEDTAEQIMNMSDVLSC